MSVRATSLVSGLEYWSECNSLWMGHYELARSFASSHLPFRYDTSNICTHGRSVS